MDDDELLPEAARAIAAALAPEQTTHDVDAGASLEALRGFVSAHVARLLDRNPALLMSILYRVDVPEARVKHAIQASPPGTLPDTLADLLIERQLQKLRLRRRYQ